jgi:Protein of unknown function (DUF2511)
MKAAITALAILLAGCSATNGGSGNDTHSIEISRSDFGSSWPLTVDHGTLTCHPVDAVTFTAPGGTTYGVNGTAMDHGYPDIHPIWAPAPGGLRKYIGGLIDRGLKLCK